jgi:hypothetical protein
MAERTPAILPRSEWLRALRHLALRCAEGTDEDTRALVGEMNALLLAAPEMSLVVGLHPVGPARLATLLDAGAHDSAVLAMLGRGAGYLLSRNGDGHSLASIALPGDTREKSASGSNPALALMGALALSLASAATSARLAAARAPAGAPALLH